ncbi:helix-turn-helix domain-containing protein [Paenibacillus sp. GCM10027626]|uniref:helix-turn-helix domain-containing protein n=1 Tax=Paenibacillus sp. GCM10027626 TaxID=3273411 RepID=UPI00363647BB
MPIKRSIDLYLGELFFRGKLPIYFNRSVERYNQIEHRHDFIEISYVSEGKGTHYAGDQAIPVSQGDIFLIPVGLSHVFRPSAQPNQPPLIVNNLVISPDAAAKLLGSLPGGSELLPLLKHTDYQHYRDHYGELQRSFQQGRFEYVSSRPGREAALYAYALAIFLFLHRADSSIRQLAAALPDRMEAVFDLIRRKYTTALTTRELAKTLGVGERQFHRLFVKYAGMTPKNYVQTVRIREACELLRTTNRKISDIGSAVGYEDVDFFVNVFREITGMPPALYRKEQRCSTNGQN